MPYIQLYPHNQTALERLSAALEEAPGAAVIQPTGTGKSFVALAFIETHPDARFLYLSPSTYIFTQLRCHAGESDILRHTAMLTYQKLCFTEDGEAAPLEPDYIILDEFHRCGAEEWGGSVARLLTMFSAAKRIGLSATPIRYLDKEGVRDMAQELFGEHIAHSYSLCQALADGVLPIPKYILADILMEEKLAARQQAMPLLSIQPTQRERAGQLLRDMRRNLSEAEGVGSIFAKHLPSPHAKLIVFCRNLAHVEQAQADMGHWLAPSGMPVRAYVCRSDDGEAPAELSAFIRDTAQDAIRLLFCVDMLNEGLHVKDVDGIVMLRPTVSPTVYLQQIGRCLASTSDTAAQPVIFDLVNNYESARIDGGEQRTFTVEFLAPVQHSGRKPPAIPFTVAGRVEEFQALIGNFDLFVSNWGRWEYIYGLLKDFLAAYSRYPRHRELYQGIYLGSWLSHQVYWLNHDELSEDKAALLRALPNWESYLEQRRTHNYAEPHQSAGKPQRTPAQNQGAWEQNYRQLEQYLHDHGGQYPAFCDDRRLYNWYKWYVNVYRAGALPPERTVLLDKLPGWDTQLQKPRKKRVSVKKGYEVIMLEQYTQAHGGHNPPMDCIVDGYPLGRKVNRLRQARKKGLLSQAEIDALSAAGMIWELRKRSPATAFDTYYAELVRYHAQYGNINVPQSYTVPDSGCKLGLFIQRMRLLRKGKTTGRLTEEQAKRLDALGMVWDVVAQRNRGNAHGHG